jgi:hypothetical protein
MTEEDHAIVDAVFSPGVKRSISLGGIKAEHADVKRLEKLDPVQRELVDDILTTGEVKDLGVAIDLSPTPKHKTKAGGVDVEKLRKRIEDTFSLLKRLVDDLGLTISKSVEATQDAIKIAEGNLP